MSVMILNLVNCEKRNIYIYIIYMCARMCALKTFFLLDFFSLFAKTQITDYFSSRYELRKKMQFSGFFAIIALTLYYSMTYTDFQFFAFFRNCPSTRKFTFDEVSQLVMERICFDGKILSSLGRRDFLPFFHAHKKTQNMRDTDKLFADVMAAIKTHNIWTISEVPCFVGISKKTLYNHYPVGSERLDAIQAALDDNKMKSRVSLRNAMFKKKDPSCLIALYKMVATPDERKALASHFLETSTDKLKPLEVHVIDPKKESKKKDEKKK